MRQGRVYDLWVRNVEDRFFASLFDPLLFYRFTWVFSCQKLSEHNRIRRAIIREYGLGLISVFNTEKLLFSRWLKGGVGGGVERRWFMGMGDGTKNGATAYGTETLAFSCEIA